MLWGITTFTGQALLGEEIVTYVLGEGSLTLTRAQEGTNAFPHLEGTDIQTYENSGMSLVGINTTFTVSSDPVELDTYFVEINRSLFTDPQRNLTSGVQQISFTNEKAFGGNDIKISQNHQFSTLSPQFNCITPGKTTRLWNCIRKKNNTIWSLFSI